jgi:hypothetical protein
MPTDREPQEPAVVDDKDAVPADAALPEAARLILDVTKNEETRFSNLNTRGVAVISATSLVTALAGVFAKELLGSSLTGWGLSVGIYGLIATLALLALTAAFIVFGVLAPKQRLVFGGNSVVDDPSAVTAALEVQKIQFIEYRQIAKSLVGRNSDKAKWLDRAYLAFFAAVLCAGATTAGIVVWKLDSLDRFPF